MVLVSLASLRTLDRLDELTRECKRPCASYDFQEFCPEDSGPENDNSSRQPLPTVSTCLEKVTFARNCLTRLLKEIAVEGLEQRQAFRALLSQAEELEDVFDQAAFIFLGFVLGAHQLRSKVLPLFRGALSRGKRTSAANLVGLAQSSLAEMRSSLLDLQQRYVVVLAELMDIAGALRGGDRQEETIVRLGPASALSTLLAELHGHFAALEDRTQRLRGALLRRGRRDAGDLPPDCAELCEALEEFCDRCSPSSAGSIGSLTEP